MMTARDLRPSLLAAALYFAAIGCSLAVSRFEGGIAMIWLGGPVLAALLVHAPGRAWAAMVGACIAANVLATGLFGVGWAAAIPLALVNAGEAIGAALVLRRLLAACWPDDALEVVTGYYLGVGLIVPIAGAAAGTLLLPLIVPMGFAHGFFHWYIGHAVGMVTGLPLALALVRAALGRNPLGGAALFKPGTGISNALVLATMILLCRAVFTQPELAALILPLAFTMYVGALGEGAVAAALPVLLALVGGALTLAGYGPLHGIDVPLGDRVQLFAVYAAFVMLCTLPLICDREARLLRAGNWRGLATP